VPQRSTARVATTARAATTARNAPHRDELRELVSRRRAAVQKALARRRPLNSVENAASVTIEGEGPQRAAAPFASADPGQPAARPSFRPGQRVKHPHFGQGMVVAS